MCIFWFVALCILKYTFNDRKYTSRIKLVIFFSQRDDGRSKVIFVRNVAERKKRKRYIKRGDNHFVNERKITHIMAAATNEKTLDACCLTEYRPLPGTPNGKIVKIGGIDCYHIAGKDQTAKGKAIVILTDVFGKFFGASVH